MEITLAEFNKLIKNCSKELRSFTIKNWLTSKETIVYYYQDYSQKGIYFEEVVAVIDEGENGGKIYYKGGFLD